MKRVAIHIISAALTLGLTPVLLLTGARILHWESTRTIVVFETTLPYLLVIAYPVFLFALAARRRLLAVLAAFVVLCHVLWVFPQFAEARHVPTSYRAGVHLTLFSQNVKYDNQSPEDVGAQIQKTNADFVFLEELSERDFDVMWQTDAFDAYHYSYVQTSYGPQGLGIFSKYPLSDAQLVTSPGFPQMRAVASVDGRSVTLWNVHMRAPVDGPVKQHWLGDLEQLHTRLQHEPGSVLVAGDFNATWSHRPFRALVTGGYHEADLDVGRASARTWPVDNTLGPLGIDFDGLIRLDHVLYRGTIQATASRGTPGNGSDHSGVVTSLALK